MKRWTLLVIFVVGMAARSEALQFKKITTVKIGGHTESVAITPMFIYVSNLGHALEPLAKDKDGYITKCSPTGKIIELKFITGLNSPKGIKVLGNKLVVADIDRVRVFDLATQAQLFEMPLKGSIFLNDVETKDDKTVFVSDMSTGKIWEINIENRTVDDTQWTIPGANGIAFTPETDELVIVSYSQVSPPQGMVQRINPTEPRSRWTKVTDHLRSYDGVGRIEGKLVISDWSTKSLCQVGPAGRLLTLVTDVAGPADFAYDPASRRCYVPNLMTGEVTIFKVIP